MVPSYQVEDQIALILEDQQPVPWRPFRLLRRAHDQSTIGRAATVVTQPRQGRIHGLQGSDDFILQGLQAIPPEIGKRVVIEALVYLGLQSLQNATQLRPVMCQIPATHPSGRICCDAPTCLLRCPDIFVHQFLQASKI